MMLMISSFLCCRMIWRAMSAGMFMDSCTGLTESTGRPLNVTEMHWKLIRKTFKFYGTCHFCKFVLLTLCPSFFPNLSSSSWYHNSFGYRCLSCLCPSPALPELLIWVQTFCTLLLVFSISCFWLKEPIYGPCYCKQQVSPTRSHCFKIKPSEMWWHFQAQMRDLAGFVETRRQLLTLKPSHRNNWIGFAVAHHMNAEWDSCILQLNGHVA
jgi:hypothetical protein